MRARARGGDPDAARTSLIPSTIERPSGIAAALMQREHQDR
jgi:hypothetical protein